MRGKISADKILKYFSYFFFFLFFWGEIGFDSSCKLSYKEIIHMKCQILIVFLPCLWLCPLSIGDPMDPPGVQGLGGWGIRNFEKKKKKKTL